MGGSGGGGGGGGDWPESGAGAQSHPGLREASDAAVVITVSLHTNTQTSVTAGKHNTDSVRTDSGAFTDSPQDRLSQTLRCRWAGSRRRWVVWAAGRCGQTTRQTLYVHVVFNVKLWIRLTGSSPGPAGRVVLPPPVHTAACRGDRPENRQEEHFLYILSWDSQDERQLGTQILEHLTAAMILRTNWRHS